jgi:prepilin-type N-terminal cleavage/methylation domain-containing protein
VDVAGIGFMKKPLPQSFGQRGFTLVEMLITTGVVAITGTIMYYILYTGMILFAKNSAINMAHQEARLAMMQMEQQIHAAVSVPYLFTTVAQPPVAATGTGVDGPAAGICFQLWDAGPFEVNATAASGQNQIQIKTNGFLPAAGERLIIPSYVIEMDIISVTGGSTTPTLTLGPAGSVLPSTVNTTITPPGGTATAVNVQCFITHRIAYVIQNNQLLYYPMVSNSTSTTVMANNITTATPFSIQPTAQGAPYSRFVTAINLSTSDAAYSNLNFKAANMFLNALEPCRAQLCSYQ